MRKLVFLALFSATSTFATAQTVRFVKTDGTGDGSSWAQASNDLQLMINQSAPFDEVWVASGQYCPIRPANDLNTIDSLNPNNAFVLQPDIKIYGGFPDTANDTHNAPMSPLSQSSLSLEQARNTRNWGIHPTTLRGISGYFWSYHIVIAAGAVGGATLDGFTITFGIAFPLNSPSSNSSITVNQQDIYNYFGGGIYLSQSAPLLVNLKIEYNFAQEGAGIYMKQATPTIINTLICHNDSENGGGGINCSQYSTPTIINTTITRNSSQSDYGHGMLNVSSHPKIYNTIIYGNENIGNPLGKDVDNFMQSSPQYRYSLVKGETKTTIPIS